MSHTPLPSLYGVQRLVHAQVGTTMDDPDGLRASFVQLCEAFEELRTAVLALEDDYPLVAGLCIGLSDVGHSSGPWFDHADRLHALLKKARPPRLSLDPPPVRLR